jgi:hypothetical protein
MLDPTAGGTTMAEDSDRGSLFEGQLAHLISVALLLVALYAAAALPGFAEGAWLGLSTTLWVWLAVADAIAHQVFVWISWRVELRDQGLMRRFGAGAFPAYKAIFAILIVLRPVLIFALGRANRGTLAIDPWLGYAVSLVLLAPAAYLMYSVVHYFEIDRAFGIDHFDPAYRNAPLVRRGIFRWTPNAMYVFGFFVLWIPALLFQSVAALAVAAFSHAYIWVHYYCTEKPDMRRIYG